MQVLMSLQITHLQCFGNNNPYHETDVVLYLYLMHEYAIRFNILEFEFVRELAAEGIRSTTLEADFSMQWNPQLEPQK